MIDATAPVASKRSLAGEKRGFARKGVLTRIPFLFGVWALQAGGGGDFSRLC